MLEHIDGSSMNDAQKRHWRSVGYFFHSWWYMELVNKYGDIPYITKVLSDQSPEGLRSAHSPQSRWPTASLPASNMQ